MVGASAKTGPIAASYVCTLVNCWASSRHQLEKSIDETDLANFKKAGGRGLCPARSWIPWCKHLWVTANGRLAMSRYRSTASKRQMPPLGYLAGILATTLSVCAEAATVANPLCPRETVSFNPGIGEELLLPPGLRFSVLALWLIGSTV